MLQYKIYNPRQQTLKYDIVNFILLRWKLYNQSIRGFCKKKARLKIRTVTL